jgi:hypothetical protein
VYFFIKANKNIHFIYKFVYFYLAFDLNLIERYIYRNQYNSFIISKHLFEPIFMFLIFIFFYIDKSLSLFDHILLKFNANSLYSCFSKKLNTNYITLNLLNSINYHAIHIMEYCFKIYYNN